MFWVSHLPSLRDSLSNSTQNLVECRAHERSSAKKGGQWVGGIVFPAERRWRFTRRQSQRRQKGSGG